MYEQYSPKCIGSPEVSQFMCEVKFWELPVIATIVYSLCLMCYRSLPVSSFAL